MKAAQLQFAQIRSVENQLIPDQDVRGRELPYPTMSALSLGNKPLQEILGSKEYQSVHQVLRSLLEQRALNVLFDMAQYSSQQLFLSFEQLMQYV